MGVNVGSLVSESYTNGRALPPPNQMLEMCGGRGGGHTGSWLEVMCVSSFTQVGKKKEEEERVLNTDLGSE